VTLEMVEAARAEFALVHPRLARLAELDDEKLDRLLKFVDTGITSFESSEENQWKRHGAAVMRSLQSEVKTQVGELTERGMGKLIATFNSLLRTDDDFFERYANGDPQLVVDFVNEYKTDVLDPYHTSRASASTTTVARTRTLPRAGASSTVVPAGAAGEPALDPKDPDAIHKRAFQRMEQRRKAVAA
jgi:hypothetical protein